ncbi:alpha/beta-hydrolase [Punctularia strigosozonata HHB-11173 SS5]|uniref:alpha/beta-hydrolase n=1 Tax=Punctularia strigosozonata (strain HHB-11173) TaxID=741275 RepID=UPI0004417D43|nr:alpha/beta-hydrolase [Punctularia strigosozonata HHB-11173 SS5]EIN11666.1 alpha/beta-hydrolase [Punctularia strigosozonata HHB-11173 SS5]
MVFFRSLFAPAIALLHAIPVVPAKSCNEKIVPVSITARNAVFGNQKRLVDDLDVTYFIQNATTVGLNYTDQVTTGYTTIHDTYDISVRFCEPTAAVKKSTVQVLTHGIGFDKIYWDFPLHPELYSYVDVATDIFGYSTLSYDRISTGNSTHPDPYNVVQIGVELEILNTLTTMVRAGKLFNTGHIASVVHIGHSYGSVLSYELAAQHPSNTDGLVLTGFSQPPPTFPSKTARSNHATLWGKNGLNLDPGYLTWNDVYANIIDFFYPPTSTRDVQEFAEANKQPFPVGELLTIVAAPLPATGFTGPAMIVTGNQDAIFCGGNCGNVVGLGNVSSIPELAGQNLPHASAFEVLIQPDTGHALNLHHNATAAYHAINEFLQRHVS